MISPHVDKRDGRTQTEEWRRLSLRKSLSGAIKFLPNVSGAINAPRTRVHFPLMKCTGLKTNLQNGEETTRRLSLGLASISMAWGWRAPYVRDIHRWGLPQIQFPSKYAVAEIAGTNLCVWWLPSSDDEGADPFSMVFWLLSVKDRNNFEFSQLNGRPIYSCQQDVWVVLLFSFK